MEGDGGRAERAFRRHALPALPKDRRVFARHDQAASATAVVPEPTNDIEAFEDWVAAIRKRRSRHEAQCISYGPGQTPVDS